MKYHYKSIEQRNKAEALIKSFSKVLDVISCRDFVEITGREGGVVLTFRVYRDGSVTER